MTLIDEDRHHEVFRNLGKAQPDKMACGGSAANTVIAASQFGSNAFYSCKVSQDSFGEFYVKDLGKNKVDSNLKPDSLYEGHTGKCIVMVTPDADRTMNTYLGITGTYSYEQMDEAALTSSQYLYIEGYLVTSENGKAAMIKARDKAREKDVKVALTLSDPGIVNFFKSGFLEVIGDGVDLIFCNEEEAMSITETDNINDAREGLKKFAKRFAITQGKNGAMIFDGDTFIDIEAYPVEAIDTNGAGDMFAGAFLYALTDGHGYASAGRFASLASSKIVQTFGPRLSQEVMNELKSGFKF
jgi:sugar/nucleoside kinase (ribokinase family)